MTQNRNSALDGFTDLESIVSSIGSRFAAYQKAPISTAISQHEDMYAAGVPRAMEHYLKVGRAAIDVIARAMLISGKSDIRSILDLPCGGGRVTRHLAAFFPEAKLTVGDINENKEVAVAREFNAARSQGAHDFSNTPEQKFDLIWVGSLMTHFDSEMLQKLHHLCGRDFESLRHLATYVEYALFVLDQTHSHTHR